MLGYMDAHNPMTYFPRVPPYVVHHYDFMNDAELSDWVFNAVGGGSAPTTVQDTDKFGVVRIATSGTTNQGINMQHETAILTPEKGKRYRAVLKFKSDVASACHWVFGWSSVDTNIFGGVSNLDAILFYKPAGTGLNVLVARAADNLTTDPDKCFRRTSVTNSQFSAFDTSDHEYAIELHMDPDVENKGTVIYYVDGVEIARGTNIAYDGSDAETGIPTNPMRLTFEYVDTSAGTVENADIDVITASIARRRIAARPA